MILEYTEDRIIEVYEPTGTSDPLKPVIVEVQAAPPELRTGWVLVLAFRSRCRPETFHVLPFHITSRFGLKFFLESMATALDYLFSPSHWSGSPPGPATVPWASDRLIRDFQPRSIVQADHCDRLLEIVFYEPVLETHGNSLGKGYGLGVPLEFSSAAALHTFASSLRAELRGLIRLVHSDTIW